MSDDKVRTERAFGKLPGRKAGQLVVYSVTNEPARFELRVDAERGDFIAVHGGLLYLAKSKDALKQHMTAVWRDQRQLTWTRYIVLDYEARTGTFGNGYTYHLGDRRPDDVKISTISLTWDVIDYSTPIQIPGMTKPRIKSRQVYDRYLETDPNDPDYCRDNEDREQWDSANEIPKHSVSYTAERYELLIDIRNALGVLDRKLNTLFDGTPEALARQLDAARVGRILASGDDE